MNKHPHAWKNPEVAAGFLDNRRKMIPFGQEQIDIMIRILSAAAPELKSFADLGCGDGILSRAVLAHYPEASGLLLDYSEPMVQAAREKLGANPKLEILQGDFSAEEWLKHVKKPVDAVVSGYAIHHLPHERKQALYKEIHTVLNPGGVFVNIEHVASVSPWGVALSDEMMIDSKYCFLRNEGNEKTKEEISIEYSNRPYQYDNILLSVEKQCQWLREIGFTDADCYFKCFELAVFAGRKRGDR